MSISRLLAGCLLAVILLGWWWGPLAAQPGQRGLEEGFRNPPPAARPHLYFMLLNGYVDRTKVEKELTAYAQAGIGGICLFDVGARGDPGARPPAGPPFLSPESVRNLAHIIRTAGRLGLEVDLAVSSSWDMGGSWVKPEDASMTLTHAAVEVEGGGRLEVELPFPALPKETPRDGKGAPLYAKDVAVLAIPAPETLPGHELVFRLRPPLPQRIGRVVLYNNPVSEQGAPPRFARDFTVSVATEESPLAGFKEVVRATLQPRGGAQEFAFPPTEARYVRLHLLNGYGEDPTQMELAEFEVYNTEGENVNLNHRATRLTDAATLWRYSSARGQWEDWAADNIHDGVKEGARGSWGSAATPALLIRDYKNVLDLTSRVDATGKLRWEAPPGQWLIVRYVCVNTGERLKAPSPNSDGLTTDHFNAEATRRYLEEVIRRLAPELGDFRKTALRDLYLPSYEVRGQVWTPAFLEEFRKRRGYDFTPFLPVLYGGRVVDEQTTERVMFDFRKTQGELLVDAYYRAAVQTAHAAGLSVESEAGGPGPPVHQAPVDALLALGAVDHVRGEFWPDRMQNSALWVVKETASAAHIYGKRSVHMEAFTSMNHWQEAPQDLKLAADRAFAEGMNHVVWHTAAHQPPEAGKPGWVYHAGTHLNLNVVWWPMAKSFLSYLARASFLLQQGLPVADVLYYYGDQGYNFVPPKQVDARLGYGYEYDVTNADVILRRLGVRDGKWTLPDGMRYEVLVLPERDDIDLAVLKRLEQLVRAGGTILGVKPQRSSGYAGYPQRDKEVQAMAGKMWADCDGKAQQQVAYGKGLVVCGLPVRQVLAARGMGPDFRYAATHQDTEVDFTHRATQDADIYFLHNKKRRWEELEVEFRVKGKRPELWDPASGERSEVTAFEFTASGTRFALRLEPEGSVFVVFRRVARAPRPARVSAPRIETMPVDGWWEVRFTAGPAPPPPGRLKVLRSWTASADPRERFFSGIAEYETEFTVPAGWLGQGQRLWLDLGELWAAGEIRLNGRELGVVWKRPFRVEVTAAARSGSNRLQVRVANNWVNRLVGDARGAPGERVTKTNITTTGSSPAQEWKDVPLRASGLMGPVKLEREQP